MRRWKSLVVTAVTAVAALSFAPGQALARSGPEFERFTDAGRFVDRQLCGYPIRVAWHEQGRVSTWLDSNGKVDRLVVHDQFFETATANGKVATGIDRQTLRNDEQGTYLFTGSWIYFLPDGSHIQNAGRIEVPYDFSTILSEHGQHPIIEGRLAELFCAAMA